jgi:hypothetical protein
MLKEIEKWQIAISILKNIFPHIDSLPLFVPHLYLFAASSFSFSSLSELEIESDKNEQLLQRRSHSIRRSAALYQEL